MKLFQTFLLGVVFATAMSNLVQEYHGLESYIIYIRNSWAHIPAYLWLFVLFWVVYEFIQLARH